MTVGEIVTRVTTTVQDISDEMKSLVKAWIKDCKTDMMRAHKFSCMMADVTVSPAGEQDIALPEDAGSLLVVKKGTTIIPSLKSNVANSIMADLRNGMELSTPGVIVITGDADNDNGGKVVIFDLDGTSESFSLNGLTQTGTKTFTGISFIFKEATADPVVVTSGTDSFTLEEGEGIRKFPVLHFNDAVTGDFDVEYFKSIRELTDDNDLDPLQVKYGLAIIEYCLSRAYRYQDNQGREGIHWAEYIKELGNAIKEDNVEKNKRTALHLVGSRW